MVFAKLVKRLTISVVLSSVLFTASYASIGDFIRNQLNGSVEVTNSGYYKTQTGGFWTGGSLRVRWDMSGANINLFHAEAPHFAVGCNGIDATFGSFSYLGFDKLVEKLKKISAAAPAMAFQMAIMTLCEQCNTIMTNLEKIADSLNNFNLNACQATRTLAGKGASIISNLLPSGGVTQDGTDTRPKVKTDTTWAITKAIETASNWFGSLGVEGIKDQLGYGSIVNKLSKTYAPALGFDIAEFEALLRGITGDLYGYSDKAQDSSGGEHTAVSRFLVITPANVDGSKFIKALVYGGNIKGIVLNENCSNNICYPVTHEDKPFSEARMTPNIYSVSDIEITPEDSIFTYVKNNLDNIISKIQAKEPLTTDEINFINAMPLPVYKIVNLVATLNLDSNSLEGVEEYLSYRILQSFVDEYFNEVNKAMNTIASDEDLAKTYDSKRLNEWKIQAYKNIRNLKKEINTRILAAEKKVQLQNDLLQKFANLEKEMKKNSPIWVANGL